MKCNCSISDLFMNGCLSSKGIQCPSISIEEITKVDSFGKENQWFLHGEAHRDHGPTIHISGSKPSKPSLLLSKDKTSSTTPQSERKFVTGCCDYEHCDDDRCERYYEDLNPEEYNSILRQEEEDQS